MATKNEITKVEKNITDSILNKVANFAEKGELVLPADYSAENALKAAWLALQTVEDKNGRKCFDVCSVPSVSNALLDMVVQGLSPAKKQCYFIVYGKELTLSRSYFGTVTVAKRFGNVESVHAQIVYQDDEFEYEIDPITSGIKVTKHVQKLENIDVTKIKAAYAVVHKTDGTTHVELMTKAQIVAAWEQGGNRGNSPAHKKFAEEMSKKTVINRACKMFINTSSDSAILVEAFNRVTNNDYRRDDEFDVIDVDETDIQEEKKAAESLIFDVDKENVVEAELVEEQSKVAAEVESEAPPMGEIDKTPFDEDEFKDITDEADTEAQVSMEDAQNE